MPATLRLTADGQRKIEAAIQAATSALARGSAREVRRARQVAAANAPSPEVEARLLSRGAAEGGFGRQGPAGPNVGTPEGGRFLRESMLSVQEAIATDPVITERTLGPAAIVVARTGNPTIINAKTGFFWRTRKRGIQGPTYPFNRAYVQALENGGAVWVVVPRSGTKALEPEPGVLARRMVKTLPPYQMYSRAAIAVQREALLRLRQDYRQAVQKVR